MPWAQADPASTVHRMRQTGKEDERGNWKQNRSCRLRETGCWTCYTRESSQFVSLRVRGSIGGLKCCSANAEVWTRYTRESSQFVSLRVRGSIGGLKCCSANAEVITALRSGLPGFSVFPHPHSFQRIGTRLKLWVCLKTLGSIWIYWIGWLQFNPEVNCWTEGLNPL
jgi:hypothetical protein